ncbi:MAG: (d)CMP kinase, partial [Pseudomonadota bacterium]
SAGRSGAAARSLSRASRSRTSASAEVRADRRWKELQGRGNDMPYDAVLADVRERDARDSDRAAAPLRPAEGAKVLDTSDMRIDEAVAAAIAWVSEKRA